MTKPSCVTATATGDTKCHNHTKWHIQ